MNNNPSISTTKSWTTIDTVITWCLANIFTESNDSYFSYQKAEIDILPIHKSPDNTIEMAELI